MDLLDLYHAHDLSLAMGNDYDEQLMNNKTIDDEEAESLNSNENGTRKHSQRKPKFVPWEPFKAAIAPNRKGQSCPDQLPELIEYGMEKRKMEKNNNENNEVHQLKDGRKMRKMESMEVTEKEMEMEKQMKRLKEDLAVEHNVNVELKKLMIATLSDELQGQVEALTEDKVRLAQRVDEYFGKVTIWLEESERLRIDRDVWKCKFLAQSIRVDELISKNEYLLRTLVRVQNAVRNIKTTEAQEFCQLDLVPLFHRSPCEERVRPIAPKFSNLTISCCKNCTGREIHLL